MTDLSIVSCKSYDMDEVRAALKAALAPFGMDWVKPGMNIAIKANLVGALKPDKAATTHPAPLKALCELLVERGASVVVGDSPGGLFTQAYLAPIYKATGMHEVEMPGVKLNDCFEDSEISFPEAVSGKTMRITKYLLDADAVIDFCKPKTHGMMAYTGACKNFYGAVPGLLKGEYHYRYSDHERFANLLVDLAQYIHPRLCIADYVWSMEGNGPTMGSPRFVGALMASESPHKMDIGGAYIMNIPFGSVPTLIAAKGRGLISGGIDTLNIEGELSDLVVPDFKRAAECEVTSWAGRNKFVDALAKKLLTSRPRPEKDICIGCGKCAEVCPAKAITMVKGGAKGKLPRIDREKCIRCFCCQEFCPVGAMRVYRPPIARLINH